MQNRPITEAVIEDLVAAYGEQASVRQKHVYREALRGLVRLAKAEHMREIKADVGWLAFSLATAANEGGAARMTTHHRIR